MATSWRAWPAANLTRWAGKSYVMRHPIHLLPGQRCRIRYARAGNPYGNDPRIISGESGAVGLAFSQRFIITRNVKA